MFKVNPFMKKKIVFVAIFLLLCFSLSAQAGLRIYLEEVNGEFTIVRTEGNVRELVIPESVNGIPVTAIGEGAFVQRGLTMLTIPDSVVEIGESAFAFNSLSALVIGDNVGSIGRNAFANNRLNDIVIGAGVVNIGTGAFADNELVSVEIPDSVVTIEPFAFFNNRLRAVVIPDSVTTIGEGAFSTNAIYSVVLGNSVEAVGDGAFFDNQIINISIPPSLNTMGRRVFEGRITQRGAALPVDFFDETGVMIFSTSTNFDNYFSTTGRRPGNYSFARGEGWIFEQ